MAPGEFNMPGGIAVGMLDESGQERIVVSPALSKRRERGPQYAVGGPCAEFKELVYFVQ